MSRVVGLMFPVLPGQPEKVKEQPEEVTEQPKEARKPQSKKK